MQIKDAAINFSQQHTLERSEQRRVVGQITQLSDSNNRENQPPAASAPAVKVDLSAFRVATEQALVRIEALADSERGLYKIDTDLLKALVEALSGEKINTADDSEEQTSDSPSSPKPTPSNTTAAATSNQAPPTIETRGSIFFASVENRYSEYEYSNVSINADLTDADGTAFSVSLNITMERSFQSRQALAVSQVQLQDPLVINFNGSTARLSDELVEFDLDSDGIKELLPSLISDSAYIAFDKNGDGIINNGTELFGATSGNGFLELAAYDEDGNGFIDSNDSIFSQLVAYSMTDGTSQSLSALDVGALATASVQSPFRLTDSQNNTLGVVRSTGFYIDDQRRAGSLQQLDLRV